MPFSYDSYGWLSAADIPGRQTEAAPPAHGAQPVVGEAWPNWTGTTWTADTLYALPPAAAPAPVDPTHGQRNYRAMISRRADALEKTDAIAALKLRLTN